MFLKVRHVFNSRLVVPFTIRTENNIVTEWNLVTVPNDGENVRILCETFPEASKLRPMNVACNWSGLDSSGSKDGQRWNRVDRRR